jgi:hypothetical protein
MQGFMNMLKMAGLDPEKIVQDAMAAAGPEIEKIMGNIQTKIDDFEANRAKEFAALSAKLDSMDEAIKSMKPDYVPEDFAAGAVPLLLAAPAEVVTNPESPEGGAVDMAALDPEKLAAMETAENIPSETPEEAAEDTAESIIAATTARKSKKV